MALPQNWQDPPWHHGPEQDPYDWRRFIAVDTQAKWPNLTDEHKWEIAAAAQRLGALQRRIVGGSPPLRLADTGVYDWDGRPSVCDCGNKISDTEVLPAGDSDKNNNTMGDLSLPLPCPACGARAVFGCSYRPKAAPVFSAKCNCGLTLEASTMGELIEAWNSQAPGTAAAPSSDTKP
jgi:hypothetical protein